MEPSQPLPERPIAWLGRYALFDELARGGMATVHIGRLSGPAGFSKTVAIKKMHAALAQDPQFQAMFLDEARLASRIQHPNVVPVLDVIAERDEAYLVMEYVEGESLAVLCRAMNGQRIAPTVAAHIGRDLLYGLHAAHEAASEQGRPLQLVHRDVSPQNILVGADGVARVLDFGVAKAVGRLQDTDTGQLKGKVSYMAPEQVLGQAVDRRADIFAAGVVLWEALAGKRLFAGSNSAESMYRVLEEPIPRLSEVAPDLPAPLVDAVERATRKDARERFQTALEFANALEQSVDLIPNHVVGKWVSQVAGETLKRKRERLRAIESVPIPADDSEDFDAVVRPSSTSAAYVRALPDDTTHADAPITVRTRPERAPRSSRLAWGVTVLVTASALVAWWIISGTPAATDTKAAAPPASVAVARPPSPVEPAVASSTATPVASVAIPAASHKPPPKKPAAKSKSKPRPESLFSRQ